MLGPLAMSSNLLSAGPGAGAKSSSSTPKNAKQQRFLARLKSYSVDNGYGFVWAPNLIHELGQEDIFIPQMEYTKLQLLCGGIDIPVDALLSFSAFLRNGKVHTKELLLEPEEKGLHIPNPSELRQLKKQAAAAANSMILPRYVL